MQVAPGTGAAITGCIGRRRRTGRVRHCRDPGRLWCAPIRRRVRAPLRHDLGRQSLDRLSAQIRCRVRTRVMAGDRRSPTRGLPQGLRRNGRPIRIDHRIRIGLKAPSGRQARGFVWRAKSRLRRPETVLL